MGLNQILNVIKLNQTIMKHAKQIIVWDTQSQQIQIIVDTNKNIFVKTTVQEKSQILKRIS